MTKTESGVTPWEDRESLYENTLFSQVERMEAEIAELRTRLAATTQASTAQAERDAVLEEAAQACMRATPDRAKVRAIGEAAHYMACRDAIRALRSAGDTGIAKGESDA